MATGKHQSSGKGIDIQKIVIIAAVAVAVVALVVLAVVFINGGEEEPPTSVPSGSLGTVPPVTAPKVQVSVVAADGSEARDLGLMVGDTRELTAIIVPNDTKDTPAWTTSDAAVVSITPEADDARKARLVCEGAGSAVVTVTVGEGTYAFTVTVQEETAPTEPEDTTPPEPAYLNPLTGLASERDLTEARPYAVMINNIRKATPQAGITRADMIFEIPVEGNITRLMGIYQDLTGLDVIGSVRSARPYFIDIARGFDAVYIHAGGSDDAYAALKSTGITHIDGTNGTNATFFRDQERAQTMGMEHSWMLDVPTVEPYLTKLGERLTHNDGFSAGFTFAETEGRTGARAERAEAKFNSSKSTFFEYDRTTGLYKVSQYDAPMTDENTGEQLAVRNVVALRVRVSPIAGDTEGRLRATLTGSGSGTYLVDGVMQTINWLRTSDGAQFTFTDEDGNPLTFAPGSTYFAILPISTGSIQVS